VVQSHKAAAAAAGLVEDHISVAEPDVAASALFLLRVQSTSSPAPV